MDDPGGLEASMGFFGRDGKTPLRGGLAHGEKKTDCMGKK